MWFTGSVSEAIGKVKAENKLLLVFIESQDEVSNNSRDSLESVQDQVLDRAIAMKLTAGSETANYFNQFYPILVVPACYIIANGKSVEVIAGRIEPEDFLTKLNKAADEMQAAAASPSSTSSTPVAGRSGSGTPQSVPSPAMAGPPPPSPATPAQPALDNKLAQAHQKLEELKARKEKEEEEREREREQQRRETGKAVLSAKRKREEQEMIEAANERKRNAAQEREHRAKLLAQIEQDKEERRKRFAQQSPVTEATSSPQPPVASPISNADETRIQFRFPDGHTLTHVFKSADPLKSAHDFVAGTESIKNFTLSQMYPRKTFTGTDMSQSFSDLHLVPSSVLLVMMQSGASSFRASQSNSASSSVVPASSFWDYIPWFIAVPFLTLWNFISSFLPSAVPPGQQQPADNQPAAGAPPPPIRRFTATAAPEPQPSTSGIRRRDLPSRSGNIHRLHDDEEDDDEKKKTWNGNSTQQM